MKTQRIFTTLWVLLIVSTLSWAQTPGKSSGTSTNEMKQKATPARIDMGASTGGLMTDKGLPGSKGGAYLDPDFTEGVIIMKDGTRIPNKPMRYNIYTQQMQFVENTDTLALANPDEIEYLKIADRTFVYTNYICKGEHKKGYFELIEDGECRLLKRWVALYHEVDQSSQESTDCDVFYRDCQCFLQFFLNPACPVEPKKNDFVMSFASKGESIKTFMKNNKLNPKNEEDLSRIVDYYNGIFSMEKTDF